MAVIARETGSTLNLINRICLRNATGICYSHYSLRRIRTIAKHSILQDSKQYEGRESYLLLPLYKAIHQLESSDCGEVEMLKTEANYRGPFLFLLVAFLLTSSECGLASL